MIKRLLAAAAGTIFLSLVVLFVVTAPTDRLAKAQVVEMSGLRSVPLGYQQISVLTASTALTVPTGATMAVIQAEAQVVRWRDDGTAPTAAIGMQIASGAFIVYNGNLAAIRFIEATASAKLNVSYYR